MAIGAFDQVGSLLYFVALYFTLNFVYENYSLYHLPNHWSQWVFAYFAIDFLSYWYHRFSHEVNILWAGHITHHSSELFNFSNGFRTSLFQGVNRILFWSVLPVFGFSPWVLLISLKVSGIYDFFLHTTYIPKLGFLEKILITPSMHRVHHGKNDIYIDKNYGSTLVVWDKLFGTYQEETEEVTYGIKAEYTDNHPLNAIGFHYKYLWISMRNTKAWTDRLKLLFMPPDWIPTDVKPIGSTAAKLHNTVVSKELKLYATYHLVTCVFGFVFFMAYTPILNAWEVVLCSMIILGSILGASLIFNQNIGKKFITWEWRRLFVSGALVLLMAASSPKPYFYLFIVYLLIALILLWFTSKSQNREGAHTIKRAWFL